MGELENRISLREVTLERLKKTLSTRLIELQREEALLIQQISKEEKEADAQRMFFEMN